MHKEPLCTILRMTQLFSTIYCLHTGQATTYYICSLCVPHSYMLQPATSPDQDTLHSRDIPVVNTHVVCVFTRSGVSVLVGSVCHEALASWSADTLSGTWTLVLTWCPGSIPLHPANHCTRGVLSRD